jgi:hypothetical protein
MYYANDSYYAQDWNFFKQWTQSELSVLRFAWDIKLTLSQNHMHPRHIWLKTKEEYTYTKYFSEGAKAFVNQECFPQFVTKVKPKVRTKDALDKLWGKGFSIKEAALELGMTTRALQYYGHDWNAESRFDIDSFNEDIGLDYDSEKWWESQYKIFEPKLNQIAQHITNH